MVRLLVRSILSNLSRLQQLGNAQDFGDLTTATRGNAAVASPTRAISSQGNDSGSNINIMDFVMQPQEMRLILVISTIKEMLVVAPTVTEVYNHVRI